MKKVFSVLLASFFITMSVSVIAAVDYKILAGADSNAYSAMGSDLAKYVAPSAGINLQVVATTGSVANVRLLNTAAGAKFAIIQSGVLQAMIDKANAGSAEAFELTRALRVVMPLFATELYYVVRADSEMNYLHDIKSAKINSGSISGLDTTTSNSKNNSNSNTVFNCVKLVSFLSIIDKVILSNLQWQWK